MGLDVTFLGRVGADADGAFLRESLAGVNLDYLAQAGASGRAYILVDPEGERTILVAPNTNDDLALKDIPLEALAGAKFLHLTVLCGGGAPGRFRKKSPAGFRMAPGSAWTRGSYTPGGASRPWRALSTIWIPCW